jgi:hypothetical protein
MIGQASSGVSSEEQLNLVSELKDRHFCKGSYKVYVTRQGGQPVRLRFVLNGQDPNAARASALNGKTAIWQTGALPGEVPVSAVEEVTGIWEARETNYGMVWLTFNGDGSHQFEFAIEEAKPGGAFPSYKDALLRRKTRRENNESAMSEKPRRYLSYLLRLWQASSGGELVWRASLEDPHTGARRGFACLAELIAYLEGEMRDHPQMRGDQAQSRGAKD